MSEVSFVCPKCKKPAHSIENGEAVKKYVSDSLSQEFIKQKMTETKMKEYRFWLCTNQKCPNYEAVYYQTDLKGNYITEIRPPSMNRKK